MVDALLRALVAQLLVCEALLTSYAAARLILGRVPVLLRWTGGVVCGAIASAAGFHLLRLSSMYDLAGALVFWTSAALLVLRAASGTASVSRWIARDRRFIRKLGALLRRTPYRYSVLAFACASLPVLLRPLVVPPLGWDSLTYHAVKAALWVQHGGPLEMVGPGTWAYYPAMWAGGEVFTSWAMLPFHGDLLAMAIESAEWLALGIALLALTRELGIREPHASAVSGFVLSMPTLRISVGSGYVELPLLLMTVSAWALGARFLRRRALGAFYLSAGAIAVAAGIKVPVLPLALLVIVIEALRVVALPLSARARVAHAAGGIALFALLVAPWPIDAALQTGLPFSPLPVQPLGVRLGEPTPELSWYMMERPDDPGRGPAGLGSLMHALLEERMGPGPTTMVAVAVGLLAWPLLWRRRRWALVLLGSAVAATCAVYAAPGFWVIRRYFASSGVRFLLLALVPLIVVSPVFCRRSPRLGRAYFLFLVAGSLFQLFLYLPHGWSAASAVAVPLVAAGAAITILALRWVTRASAPIAWRALGCGAVIALAMLGLQALRDEVRLDVYAREFAIHPIHPYWLEAAKAVDSGGSHRIAVTSGPMQDLDNWIVYPLLGRALQNEVSYVPVTRDGTILHFGGGPLDDEYARRADYAVWYERLVSRRISEVMSFRPASIELAWMEAHPAQFRRVAGDGDQWGLFEVVQTP